MTFSNRVVIELGSVLLFNKTSKQLWIIPRSDVSNRILFTNGLVLFQAGIKAFSSFYFVCGSYKMICLFFIWQSFSQCSNSAGLCNKVMIINVCKVVCKHVLRIARGVNSPVFCNVASFNCLGTLGWVLRTFYLLSC